VTDKRRMDPQTYQVRESSTPSPGVTDPNADEPYVDVLDSDVELVEAKVAELTEDLQRIHAEYANYRRRVERDREVAREAAIGSVLADLLPILDDLERAREHGDLTGAFKTVGESLEATLAKLGLERFGAQGEPFDPAVHEAISSQERDGLDGPIVDAVYQPGYRFAQRVLRPARVAVADAP
jgi:molecular chaperone GrpE